MTPFDLLSELIRNTFTVFELSFNEDNGLYSDNFNLVTGQPYQCANIAASGCGFVAMCIAAGMGWIDSSEAQDRIALTMQTYLNMTEGVSLKRSEVGGFFQQFIDMEVGYNYFARLLHRSLLTRPLLHRLVRGATGPCSALSTLPC